MEMKRIHYEDTDVGIMRGRNEILCFGEIETGVCHILYCHLSPHHEKISGSSGCFL